MEKLGELVLLEKIAYGGMAEVFRAKQLGYQGFEKIVAVKRILPHYAQSKRFKKMFMEEASLSATLEHPNITHVYKNGESGGYLYLVMEFIDGRNLRQFMAKAKETNTQIPLEISCFIVSEMLKGLEYAHTRIDQQTGAPLNIVHRDISPQNIMLSYEGSVKLVDFGIAKAASSTEVTQGGTLKGKFSYMSPEQAFGNLIDRRSDVFSAGIILWEMLTQTRLYSTEDEIKTLEKAREAVIPPPSDIVGYVPATLEKIVLKALERDVLLRYASSLEFYSDLIRFLNTRKSEFIPTDFTVFMKNFFKDEIAQDRVDREALKKVESQIAEKVEIVIPDATPEPTTRVATSVSSPVLKEDPTQVSKSDIKDAPVKQISQGWVELVQDQLASKPQAIRVIDEAPRKRSAPYVQEQKSSRSFTNTFFFFALLLGAVLLAIHFKVPSLVKEYLAQPSARRSRTQATDSVALPPSAVASSQSSQVSVSSLSIPDPNEKLFIWEPYAREVFGSLDFSSVPDADLIYIDGEKLVDAQLQPLKTPLKNFQLNPGTYKFVFKNTSFGVSKEISVNVIMGRTSKYEVLLQKP